jgi:hypothetical protein
MRNICALKTRINGRPRHRSHGKRAKGQETKRVLREVCCQNILMSKFIVRRRRVHSREVKEQH